MHNSSSAANTLMRARPALSQKGAPMNCGTRRAKPYAGTGTVHLKTAGGLPATNQLTRTNPTLPCLRCFTCAPIPLPRYYCSRRCDLKTSDEAQNRRVKSIRRSHQNSTTTVSCKRGVHHFRGLGVPFLLIVLRSCTVYSYSYVLQEIPRSGNGGKQRGKRRRCCARACLWMYQRISQISRTYMSVPT